MGKIGAYCKAYTVRECRAFGGWSEKKENARTIKKQVGDQEIEEPRELSDDDILYLHENFNITDGIFLEEHVIFDQVTPEWIEFCQNTLHFAPPPQEPEMAGSS
jgi:hypothetical protein